MEVTFIDNISEGKYQIAAVDPDKIYAATNPAKLANVFECPEVSRSASDDAQIFYALAPSIHALDFTDDISEIRLSSRLNKWSVSVVDSNNPNIFNSIRQMSLEEREELYKEQHSVSPHVERESSADSLLAIVFLAECQKWKTGVLQRCIDCLVKEKYRKNPHVYAVVDYNYFKIMRFVIETQNPAEADVAQYINIILKTLKLKNSHDTSSFTLYSDSKDGHMRLNILEQLVDIISKDDMFKQQNIESLPTLKDKLNKILFLWSGASVSVDSTTGEYKLRVCPLVLEGVSYMNPYLPRPDFLLITDAPL